MGCRVSFLMDLQFSIVSGLLAVVVAVVVVGLVEANDARERRAASLGVSKS